MHTKHHPHLYTEKEMYETTSLRLPFQYQKVTKPCVVGTRKKNKVQDSKIKLSMLPKLCGQVNTRPNIHKEDRKTSPNECYVTLYLHCNLASLC